MPIGTSAAQRAEARRSSFWTGIAVAGFVLVGIAILTAYYFGTVQEEFLVAGGRILNCGTLFTPIDSGACGGSLDGDATGFAVAAVLAVIGIVAIVSGVVRSRTRRRRR